MYNYHNNGGQGPGEKALMWVVGGPMLACWLYSAVGGKFPEPSKPYISPNNRFISQDDPRFSNNSDRSAPPPELSVGRQDFVMPSETGSELYSSQVAPLNKSYVGLMCEKRSACKKEFAELSNGKAKKKDYHALVCAYKTGLMSRAFTFHAWYGKTPDLQTPEMTRTLGTKAFTTCPETYDEASTDFRREDPGFQMYFK